MAQDDLLQEHERALVVYVLPYLHEEWGSDIETLDRRTTCQEWHEATIAARVGNRLTQAWLRAATPSRIIHLFSLAHGQRYVVPHLHRRHPDVGVGGMPVAVGARLVRHHVLYAEGLLQDRAVEHLALHVHGHFLKRMIACIGHIIAVRCCHGALHYTHRHIVFNAMLQPALVLVMMLQSAGMQQLAL